MGPVGRHDRWREEGPRCRHEPIGIGVAQPAGWPGSAVARRAAQAWTTTGETGYWAQPSASALVENEAKIPMDAYGLLRNIGDIDKVAPFQRWARDFTNCVSATC